MKPLAHRSLFVPVLVSLIVLAWATLFVRERSPYGRSWGAFQGDRALA